MLPSPAQARATAVGFSRNSCAWCWAPGARGRQVGLPRRLLVRALLPLLRQLRRHSHSEATKAGLERREGA